VAWVIFFTLNYMGCRGSNRQYFFYLALYPYKGPGAVFNFVGFVGMPHRVFNKKYKKLHKT
jgi:hypothetical protein